MTDEAFYDYEDPRSLADRVPRWPGAPTPGEIRERARIENDPRARAEEEERIRRIQAEAAARAYAEAPRRRALAERALALRQIVEGEVGGLVDAARARRWIDEAVVGPVVRRLAERTGLPEAELSALVDGVVARAQAGWGMASREIGGLIERFAGEQVSSGWAPPEGSAEEYDPRELAAQIRRRP